MRTVLMLLILNAALTMPATAFSGAQSPKPTPLVCVAIDETRDTLPATERAAAAEFLLHRFEAEGWRTIDGECTNRYVASHVRLGRTILVTLSGPAGHREGTALGVDDLPALYSQMVRSLVTGEPMSGFHVVDRTNVTTYQSTRPSVPSHTFTYGRVGPGILFSGSTHATPAIGFGYRAELDDFALDLSILNVQTSGAYSASNGASSTSWIRLEALRFLKPEANSTAYWGAGLGVGSTYVTSGTRTWSGDGLKGELTAGYELPRSSTVRMFIQADAVLPFYFIHGQDYAYGGNYLLRAGPSSRRYAPSVTLTLGMGWNRQ